MRDQGSSIVAIDKNLDITDRVLAKLRRGTVEQRARAGDWGPDGRAVRSDPSADAAARLIGDGTIANPAVQRR